MPPKKRDKSADEPNVQQYEQIQTDHELFLQAFEKPTQIYRYLRTRHLVSPIFLTRTLSFMRHRMSRTHKNRKFFKVDSILERVEAKLKQESQPERPHGHMTLTFTGFYDKHCKGFSETVTIEATLLKICHKKRKDVSSPVMQLSVGKCEVPRNPDRDNPPTNATALSIPSDTFNLSNGHLVKSYVLLLRVTSSGYAKNQRINGVCNGDGNDSDEPPQKKRKNGKNYSEEVRNYGAELVVYDKHQRCLLTDGEYQLVLQECSQKSSPRKMSSWETFSDEKERITVAPFDMFHKGPIVTFRLSWNSSMVNGSVDMPRPLSNPTSDYQSINSSSNNNNNSKAVVQRHSDTKPNGAVHCPEKLRNLRIFYQFLYNNNTRQQTEARDDLHCPWCSLNCLKLYSLMKHLKLCHSRFIFTYVPHPKGARIDVSINECYDGSYAGNPHDLQSQTGFAFSRNGPVRRTPVTHVMVCRPKRPVASLSEFLEPDDTDVDGPRPCISGHNRLYYHTGTCLPIRPQEIDIDSESENDPEWLQIKTQHMIDEFTDVNEGEKELMKMWNLHIMKYGFVGDCQIPLACSMFVEHKGQELLEKSLYKNFLLHLSNLFDFGLISASVVYNTTYQLQKLREELEMKKKNNPPAS